MALKITRLPREEFRAHGYKQNSAAFSLIKIKANAGKNVRLGVVAGKSVAKTAVKRNFFKRQARAIVAKKVKAPVDVLVIISPRAAHVTKKEFQEGFSAATEKIFNTKP